MTTATRAEAKHDNRPEGESAPVESHAQPGSKHKPEPEGDDSPQAKRAKKSEAAKEQAEEIEKSEREIESPSAGDSGSGPEAESGTAVERHGREGFDSAVLPGILEKGVIHFFFRGPVGIDEPSSVDDVARSYIILQPFAKDANLGSVIIGDAADSRLVAIYRKVLPQNGRDRWIAFVEKSGVSFKQLKEDFLASSDYDTKTAGTRHTPAAAPIGEGVYVITTTGRESILAYVLTLPDKLGEAQTTMGLKSQDSFLLSTKNPEYPVPANTRLPETPNFPKEVQEEFRSLRWMPTQPKHLDYANTQFLLLGKSSVTDKALEPQGDDGEAGAEKPADELEKLEAEDEERMAAGLDGDDASRVFADLQAQAGDYPKLQTKV
ncbi:hypothetical protein B0T26DRAFT_645376 [Lasiosphaeria miniovina]|uniref:BTB domain transcription factor n=1 Tax=Lasiosphaeria miniovina TaxID=1954250 RepID=A0AA40AJ90_9PEZI|nr:uncharacterized protein B0T26DRAFT_645376 [Lasiosphaeria miniovina]KAK0716896.1 hypothetical protein B0T26DRAFT_645376 [Lasiosphaeria miniovina]